MNLLNLLRKPRRHRIPASIRARVIALREREDPVPWATIERELGISHASGARIMKQHRERQRRQAVPVQHFEGQAELLRMAAMVSLGEQFHRAWIRFRRELGLAGGRSAHRRQPERLVHDADDGPQR